MTASLRGVVVVSAVMGVGCVTSGGGMPDGSVTRTCETRAVATLGTGFFTDVSTASGLQVGNFVPNPPMRIPINDHSRLGFVDLNGDGWDDAVMHSLYPNLTTASIPLEHLVFLNNKDGTFTDFTDASGLRTIQAGFFAFGDLDNDGDQDCFAGLDVPTPGLTHTVLLNDGQGHFTPKAGAGFDSMSGATYAANGALADFNGDAKLDLFIANGHTSYAVPDQLYFGNGDGTFTNVTSRLTGTNPARPSNGLVACDGDDDGDIDLFVATYGVSVELGHKILWENDGTGTFTNTALARGFAALAGGNPYLSTTGFGGTPEPGKTAETYMGSNAFGIDCQDVNGDGRADIFMAAISHPVDSDYSRKWSDGTQLLVNTNGRYGDEFAARGLPFNEGDIDAAMMDFDNDGYIDLSLTRDRKYEGGYTTAEQKAWLGLMHQLPSGLFESVGITSGINDALPDGGVPMGVMGVARMKSGQNHAWSDVDHDGDLDLLVGGRDQGGGRPNFLFRNDIGAKNSWLGVRLIGDGITINRDAIGAKVTIVSQGRTLVRERKSTRGTYNSLDTAVQTFGLGGATCIDSLEVRWPNGTKTTLPGSSIELNRFITIDFATGLRATSP